MEQLLIAPQLVSEMILYAEADYPNETCGLVGGIGETVMLVIQGKNTYQSPIRFRMDPIDQFNAIQNIEFHNYTILGVYHSHPTGPPFPSETDLAEHFDPAAACIILTKFSGNWQVKAFIIENRTWEELPLLTGVLK
jgi:proteasome lid subunit RPN8/RPN11